MKKIILSLLILVAIVGIWMLKQTEDDKVKADKPIVKIGVIYPMSGEVGHFGEAMKTAIKIFEKEPEAADSKYKFQFIVEDNQLSPSKSALIARKLIDVDKVDAIVTIGSDIGQAISPIAQQAKVIHMALATEENVAKGEYNFTTATPPNKNTEKLIDELIKNDLKNAAFVVQNTSAMLSVAGYIREAGKEGKINIFSDNAINSGERDFRILIAKILKDNPQVVIAQLQPPEISIFVKQLKEQNSNIPVTNVESLGYPEDKSLFEGYWFVNAVAPGKYYMEKFNAETALSSTNYSEFFYAALEILRKAFTTKDKEQVIKNILAQKFISRSIGEISFSPEGILQSEATVYEIKNGQPVLVEE